VLLSWQAIAALPSWPLLASNPCTPATPNPPRLLADTKRCVLWSGLEQPCFDGLSCNTGANLTCVPSFQECHRTVRQLDEPCIFDAATNSSNCDIGLACNSTVYPYCVLASSP